MSTASKVLLRKDALKIQTKGIGKERPKPLLEYLLYVKYVPRKRIQTRSFRDSVGPGLSASNLISDFYCKNLGLSTRYHPSI